MFSLRNNALTRLPVARPLGETEVELDRWLGTVYGDYLLEQEQQCLRQAPAMPGYHLLQLGMTPRPLMIEGFPHLHRFTLASGNGVAGGAAVADFAELPLPCDSIDALILHHALDFSPSPHSVLREAIRVLMPGGHIVVVGFNPLSLWGLIKPVGQLFTRQAIWRYNSLLRGRVADWLEVLHCMPVWQSRGGYQPPGCNRWWLERTPGIDRWGDRLFPLAGAFYVVVARKTVARPIYNKGLRWGRVPVPSLALRRVAAHGGNKVKKSA